MPDREQILVVDDAPTVRQVLKLLLEGEGYLVDVAGSAAEAIAALGQRTYQLLIVDKNLDDQDGFAVCRAARELYPDAARILVTADRSVESAIQAVEEDIFSYLTKPLGKQQVLLRVRRALDRVRLAREREEALAEMQSAKEALERRSGELERALAELVRTQARLAESEKLVSVGLLAAGVAHEINNPACFILPNLEYIKRAAHSLGDQARAPRVDTDRLRSEVEHIDRMVDRCLEGVTRIQQVVGTLQLFSRREPAEVVPVDLNALCLSLLDLVSHELGGRARLEVDLAPVPLVRGREQELAQVVLDLLHNARRSIFASERATDHLITVGTGEREEQVVLTISDSGPPLDSGGKGQALDAFYFDSSAGRAGPGLSLSLAREILDRHGGHLTLNCDESGNLLTASLPAAVPGTDDRGGGGRAGEPSGGRPH